MNKKEYTRSHKKTLTIAQLQQLIAKMDCTREEAHRIGAKVGIHPRYIDLIRSILGFTRDGGNFLSKEAIDMMIQAYIDNPDKSAYQIFKENKDRFELKTYQNYYQLLKNHGFEINRKRDFWTIFKQKQLVEMYEKKHMTFKQISAAFGNQKSLSAIQAKYKLIKTKGFTNGL